MLCALLQINLASQSVLEGLNAVLDHRGEVFVPELGITFSVQPSTKLFACQNPMSQGGGRKGLPKSFLNRFTMVCMLVFLQNVINDLSSRCLWMCYQSQTSTTLPTLYTLR